MGFWRSIKGSWRLAGCRRKRNNEKHTISFENIDFFKKKELAFEF